MSKNELFKCKGCPHRVTTNQLRRNRGVCIYCGTKMHHDNWRGHTSVSKQLNLSVEEDAEIMEFADSIGMDPSDMMRIAILNRFRYWKSDPSGQELRKDAMIEKLYSHPREN